jgi:hypothetical protein
VSGDNTASLALLCFQVFDIHEPVKALWTGSETRTVNMIYFGADGVVMVGSFLLYSTQGLDNFTSSFIFQ